MQGRLLDAVPLNSLTGVGAAQSSKLAKIGLHTVQDLLLHLPLRYEDRTHLYLPVEALSCEFPHPPGCFGVGRCHVVEVDNRGDVNGILVGRK